MAKDIYNSPYHVQHYKCASYFCKGDTISETNLVKQAENSGMIDGMMIEIVNAVNRLVTNSNSLIIDVDNNICEQFNSVINKYIGGKRTNLSQ